MNNTELTTEQQAALWRVWNRSPAWWGGNRPRYCDFMREAVSMIGGNGCVIVKAGAMYLGIEQDGYTHS